MAWLSCIISNVVLASLVGLVARLLLVAWVGGGSMPGDAHFYRILAGRIAEGHGYTWLWPDGAVTFVAHYPVGLPAALAAFKGKLDNLANFWLGK